MVRLFNPDTHRTGVGYCVLPCSRADALPFILGIHYARRVPSISYCFGLYFGDCLVGVVSYGVPPSASLRCGVAGVDNAGRVLELNRLVLLHNKPNEASRLVGGSLRLLPRDSIVVSFADASMGHVGFVYQATNFRYYGLSAKRTDWRVRGREHLHGITVADEFRGVPNRSVLMREKYGDDFYLVDRPRKHRYVFCCDRRDWVKIRYEQQVFPKGV